MTQEEYDKRLAELEAEADRRGCCIIPAQPIPPPDAGGTGGGGTPPLPAQARGK